MKISKSILKKGLLLFLKVFSMGIKFLFFSIFLPKKMPVSDYGDLSLLITTITLFIFIVGFDFYNYAHRDFINDNQEKIRFKLCNQLVFNTLLFIIICPFFYVSMSFNNLSYITIGAMLLFTEYFGQEVYRLLVVFSRPVLANLIMFFRSSLWIIILLFVSDYYDFQIEIFDILVYWLFSNSALVLLCFIVSFSLGYVPKNLYIDWKWIKKGFIISIPFLMSTITLKIIELSDRYIISYFYSNVEVGIYSFYANISNSLNVVINTAVVIMIYPKILKSFKENDKEKLKKHIKAYKNEMIIFLSISVLLLIILINPVLDWVGKIEYNTELGTYTILLFGNVFFNLSLIPHIILYGLHKDNYLIRPVIYACIVNIVLNFVLLPILGLIGAGISTLVSFCMIFAIKFYYIKKLNLDVWQK